MCVCVAVSGYVEAGQVSRTIRIQRRLVVLKAFLVSRDDASSLATIPLVADLQLTGREIKEWVEDSYHDPKS